MLSSIKSISLFLLLMLLLTGFFPSTTFCIQKPEDSTSSMTGVLSIGPDGNIYIKFTKSHAAFTVGKMIMGQVPLEELTTNQADQHEFQKAAYIAYNAWEKCEEAKESYRKGKIPLVQMEWACARYKAMTAEEVLIGTKAILDNLGSEIEWAKPLNEISKLDNENAKQEEQDAIDRGAEPTALGYEPPSVAEGVPPPINISDPGINTNNILDTLPIRNTEGQPISPS